MIRFETLGPGEIDVPAVLVHQLIPADPAGGGGAGRVHPSRQMRKQGNSGCGWKSIWEPP
jgi:hypothetical protein